jgi:hypothetical protein
VSQPLAGLYVGRSNAGCHTKIRTGKNVSLESRKADAGHDVAGCSGLYNPQLAGNLTGVRGHANVPAAFHLARFADQGILRLWIAELHAAKVFEVFNERGLVTFLTIGKPFFYKGVTFSGLTYFPYPSLFFEVGLFGQVGADDYTVVVKLNMVGCLSF